MNQWLRAHKSEVFIFCIALGVRLLFFVLAFFLARSFSFSFPSIGSDSQDYLLVARGFLEHGSFFNLSSQLPESYAVPFYPAFLALVVGLGWSILSVSLIQDILMAFVAVMIYKIGLHVSRFVAWIAALLFVFDPASIFYSNFIVTEPFYIFFVIASIYACTQNIGSDRKKMFIVSGILLGLATMVRPVGIVLLPGVAALLLLLGNMSWKQNTIRVGLLIIGFLVVVFPYMLRNKIIFNQWELSSVASWQFLYSHSAHYYAYKNGIDPREAELIFHERLIYAVPEEYKDDVRSFKSGTLFISPYMWEISLGYIQKDVFGYTPWYIFKTLPFFISDGLRDLAQRMYFIPLNQPSFTNLLISNNIAQFTSAVLDNARAFVLLVIGFSAWILINFFQLVGFLAAYRRRGTVRALIFACFFFVMATAAIAGGAVAHSRYRMSVSPFIFIVAAYGFEYVRARVDSTRKRE